jgi:hypothetical protein
MLRVPYRGHLLDNNHCCIRQRHPVFPARFRPYRRDRPDSVGHVDFVPPGADGLAGPRRRQNREFENLRANTILAAATRP